MSASQLGSCVMNIDLAALPDDIETLQRMVRSLAAERTALSEAQAEIERLRLIVEKLQRSQFGRRAERLDEGQLQFGFEDLEADVARAEAKLPSSAQKASSSKLPRGDRPSLPSHLPREDRRLDIEHQACPCCGGEVTAARRRGAIFDFGKGGGGHFNRDIVDRNECSAPRSAGNAAVLATS
jgi:hypothetical protein